LKLVGAGVLLGFMGALLVTRLLQTWLYVVSASDPLTFSGAAFLLGLVALLACYFPARRATQVDPLVALRRE
jgi:putative ABC transport system permease protein